MLDKTISVIIPNYNGEDILNQNLPYVLDEAKKINAPIIIVDDKSKDNSVQLIKSKFPQVNLIQKPKNEGFSSTVNLGVSHSKTDLVCLLNSDVRPEPNFLETTFAYFNDPQVAAVGLQDRSDDGELHGRGQFIFHQGFLLHQRLSDHLNSDLNTEKNQQYDDFTLIEQLETLERGMTGWVSGGSGVFSKIIWDKLGGLDPILNPFYFEDVDYGYRAWKSGYKMYFEPNAVVHHIHNTGAIKTNYDQNRINKISYRNQFLMSWKNLTSISLIFNHILNIPHFLLVSLKNRDLAALKGFFSAIPKYPLALKSKIINNKQFKLSDEQVLDLFEN